jgi:hypothetical protein
VTNETWRDDNKNSSDVRIISNKGLESTIAAVITTAAITTFTGTATATGTATINLKVNPQPATATKGFNLNLRNLFRLKHSETIDSHMK